MTIAQQLMGKKSYKQQEEPLVPNEKSVNQKDVEEGRPVVVTMHAHVRHVSSLTTLCVFATALLVLTTGIIGGMYLYRHFTHYKLRHFRGWCSIPYLPDIQSEVSQQFEPIADSIKYHGVKTEAPKFNYFEEGFDIDVKFEQYERIEVPSFERGRHAQFVHDFVSNRTGIVDIENRRCFVMVLYRNYVYPPRELYEQITKMRAGYYVADTQTVRHAMRVLTPPMTDLKDVGLIIARDCAQMPIYMLEKATSPVYKRSLSKENDVFVEFAGKKINEFKIINLNDATPLEN